MKKTAITFISLTMLTGCVTTAQWQANQYHDEFTGENTCRVEMGSAHQREFGRAMSGAYYSHNFYAENHDGQIRAGVRSEPAIPINGDVQIKVGDNATVFPEGPVGGQFNARVTVVDRLVDAASGTFGVRLEVPNPDNRLPAGLKCRVSFLP